MEEVDDSLEFFETEITQERKGRGRKKDRDVYIKKLEEVAQTDGLSGRQIERLVDIAACGSLSEAVSNKLIRCLIPRRHVPVKAALAAVSWMCTNKPSSNVQNFLIRWLLLVFELLDNKEKLYSVYGILFCFLENDTMVGHICHLLYLLTRKQDVRIFRVRALLNLQARVGSQPHILGLLSLYKLYCPTLVALSLSRNKVFFRQTDRVWASQISGVQEKRHQIPGRENYSYSQRVDASMLSVEPKNKKRRVSLIPDTLPATVVETQPSYKQQLYPEEEISSIPVEHIKSFKELLQNIHRIEMPSQMASVLKNTYLQYVICLNPDSVAPQRLSYWLHNVLHEEFLNQPKESKRETREQLLKALNQFADYAQEGVPVCENFLMKYLHVWNGADHRASILKLITRLRLLSFSVLGELILEPLRKLFFSSTVYFKCQVICTLTMLVRNLAYAEWPRYQETLRLQEAKGNVADTTLDESNYMSLFLEEVEKFNGFETLFELISFVDILCSVGLQAESRHSLLMHCILNFWDLIPQLYLQYRLPLIVSPSRAIFFQAIFSNSAAVVSRLLELMCSYRESFESLRRKYTPPNNSRWEQLARAESLARVSKFNPYILDTSNIIWLYKAFSPVSHETVFNLIDQTELDLITVPNHNSSLSLHRHQALMGFVWFFLKETQPPGSRVHPVSLVRVKDTFVRYLELRNVHGIQDFVKAFINRDKKKSLGTTQTQQ